MPKKAIEQKKILEQIRSLERDISGNYTVINRLQQYPQSIQQINDVRDLEGQISRSHIEITRLQKELEGME